MNAFVFNPQTGEIKEVRRKLAERYYDQDCIFENKADITIERKRKLMKMHRIDEEVFMLIPGTDESYISNFGRAKKMRDGKDVFFYVPSFHKGIGSVMVKIVKHGVCKQYRLSHLVAERFAISKSDECQTGNRVLCHVNGDLWDSSVYNLKFVSRREMGILAARKTMRSVELIHLKSGAVVESYASITEAARCNFFHPSTIHNKIKLKKNRRWTDVGLF